MPKFMILYNSSISASDAMANATPEEMKASMDEWMKWKAEAEKSSKFEFGMPLQAVSKVTTSSAGNSSSQVSGYSLIEGDKAAIVELLKRHPHLKRADAYIDLLEVMPMPGM